MLIRPNIVNVYALLDTYAIGLGLVFQLGLSLGLGLVCASKLFSR